MTYTADQGDADAHAAAVDEDVVRHAYNSLILAIFQRAVNDVKGDDPDEYCAAVMWLVGDGESWWDIMGGDCNVLRVHLSGARQPALRMWEG